MSRGADLSLFFMSTQLSTKALTLDFEKGSFRDRTSRVLLHGDRVFRVLDREGLNTWRGLREQEFYKRHVEHGGVIGAVERSIAEFDLPEQLTHNWVGLLEHERIPFISYPYEWSFAMLRDAALLQLELLSNALSVAMILKDASPYNVQWRGTSPVFIDTASFVSLPKGAAWAGYRQFCELFLFPLMLQAYKGVPFQPWLRGSLEGISATDMNRLMSLRDLLRKGVLMHVKLQARLQARFDAAPTDMQGTMKQAGFNRDLIIHNVNSLKKLVGKLQWQQSKSTWSNYVNEHNYSSQSMEDKVAFIRNITSTGKYRTVWDLGCNTGTFSRIAAEHADHVIAVDYDPLAIDHLYRALRAENNSKVLPLVGNLADPSPGIGWRNMERKPLKERGRPDLVMGLALIHHLVISANIPLDEAINWFADLGGDLIIEFVDKTDSMTRKLLLNKQDDYSDYTQENFENLLGRRFGTVHSMMLESGTRTLYYAQR